MPQTEAPVEKSEPASSRVSVVDSSPSETESLLSLSDTEFEISVANSIANSSHSDDIVLEVEAIGNESDQLEPSSAPLSPVVDYDKWKLPIEYNLKQMLVRNIFYTKSYIKFIYIKIHFRPIHVFLI